MKVGDLVKLKQQCLFNDRWATIIAAPDALNCVKIIFLDNGTIISALPSNLEVICEGG